MKVKSVCVLMLFLVSIIASVGLASAAEYGDLSVDITSVEVDGMQVIDTDVVTAGLEKDNLVEVEVEFKALADSKVEIEAELSGDGNKDKISDSTDEFNVHNGTTYTKRLKLQLPQRMDQDRTYQLRVTVSDKHSFKTVTGTLDVAAVDHSLQIRDIVLSPENEVKAGRALLVSARLKNRGLQEEEDVKVKASIPALGISASDFVDELDAEGCNDEDCDDSTSSEELYMRIPDCAEPGEYTVKVCVEFDDGDEEECSTTKINVVESDTCSGVISDDDGTAAVTGKTIITIGPETQDISVGGSGMYPVTITNQGSESRTYSISVDSATWADFSVTPSNVLVVGPGESKAAYVSATPKSTATGLQLFSVTIKSGETVLKQVPLRANITGGASKVGLGSIKRALEIGLVVLVVLLVILALIIGFNKLKGSGDEEGKEDEKTYY